ncbi:MAG: PKD domain-containing protein, partial [Candidatus Micrarchaeaceae archaeon]
MNKKLNAAILLVALFSILVVGVALQTSLFSNGSANAYALTANKPPAYLFASASTTTTASTTTITVLPRQLTVQLTPQTALISADINSPTFTADAVGGTGTGYQYKWTLPTGLTAVNGCNSNFDISATCQVSGSALNSPYTITVVAEDSSVTQTATNTTTLTINKTLEVSTFTCSPVISGQCLISGDQDVTFSNTTSGGTGDVVYSYSVTSGSGTLVSQGNNKFSFSAPGSYKVALNVNDKSGETNSSSVNIQVNQSLTTTLIPNRTLISTGQSVSFTNTTLYGTGVRKFTYFVNGNPASTSGYAINYNKITFFTAGSYVVSLGVKDQSGEISNSSTNVKVVAPLRIALYASNTTIVVNHDIQFTNLTTNGTGSDNWIYKFNGSTVLPNGVSYLGKNKFEFTLAPVKYLVTLYVNDLTGEFNQSSVPIAVNESLTVNDTKILYPGSEKSGIPVFSRDQVVTDEDPGASGGQPPYTYEWTVKMPGSNTFNPANCGPGATGPVGSNVPCEFATNSSSPLGQYNFQLAITDSETPRGPVSSQTEPFNLNASLVLSSFTCTHFVGSGCLISPDQTITFSNSITGGTGGVTYKYSGTAVGNMTYVLGQTFSFSTAGTYKLNLRVQDQAGENDTSSLTIQVNKTLTTSLTCTHFVGSGCLISPDQQVTFSNKTQYGTGGNIYAYTGTATGNMTAAGSDTFTFSKAGTYKLNLGVVDQSGETNSSSVTIQVNKTLTTSLTCTQPIGSGCHISAGQNVTFSNSTQYGTGGDVYTYTGTATGNMTSIGGNIWIFNSAGTYKLNLDVRDISGEVNSSDVVITVTPPLEVTLLESANVIIQGDTVNFTNTTSGGTGSDRYYYTTSNTAGVTFKGNSATFTKLGTYNITLHVSDISGEHNVSSNVVTVDEQIIVNESFTTTPTVSQDQIIKISSDGAVGDSGIPPYTYEWFYFYVPSTGQPGTAHPAPCPTSLTCIMQTNSMTPGQYDFFLQVTDSAIPNVSIDSPITFITVTPALQITSFYTSPSMIYSGQNTILFSTISGGTGNNIYSYTVNDITGVKISGNSLTFTSTGNYLVTLSVKDKTGENTTANTVVTVTTPLKTELFNTSRLYISANQNVNFTNTTTGGTGSNVYTYFVDGKPNTTTVNTVKFPNSGNYAVTLGVKDSAGDIANSMGINVIVAAPLEITSFSNTTGKISAGQSVTFTNTTTGGTGKDAFTYFVNGAPVIPNANGSITFASAN